ncbi:MAG: DNA-processing protein DprA, partial [Candidatus Dojkabacteria bacterium]
MLSRSKRYHLALSGKYMKREFKEYIDKNLPEDKYCDKKDVNGDRVPEGVCVYGDWDYPEVLAGIADPPSLFYYEGDLSVCELPLIAVVGTRNCNIYGEKIAKSVVSLARLYGVGLVSGMAKGIDMCAHKRALEIKLPQVAVVPEPLSKLNPERRKFAREIVEAGGLVISEFDEERWEFFKGQYITRNRII